MAAQIQAQLHYIRGWGQAMPHPKSGDLVLTPQNIEWTSVNTRWEHAHEPYYYHSESGRAARRRCRPFIPYHNSIRCHIILGNHWKWGSRAQSSIITRRMQGIVGRAWAIPTLWEFVGMYEPLSGSEIRTEVYRQAGNHDRNRRKCRVATRR